MMRPSALILSIGLLLGPSTAKGQDVSEGFVESLNVNLVTVDVMVEDQQGNPVRGLTAADFTVTEDGRPVAVSHFREVTAAEQTSPSSRPMAGQAPTRVETLGTAVKPVEEVSPLHVVVYIDDANLRPVNRRKVLPHLKTWLHHLPGHTRVMVVRALRSAEVVLPFTTNHDRATSELEGLIEAAGGRGQVAAGRQELLNDLYSEKEETFLRNQVFAYADSMHHDLGRSIRSLSTVVDELAGLPGRKALLYVNDGVSIRPGEELFEVLEERFGDTVSRMRALDYDLSREFLRLSRKAAAARIAISSVDAAGLRPPSNADVTAYRAGRSSFADSIYLGNLQEPLQMMADESGGRAIINTNLIDRGLQRAASSLTDYYEVAYSSSRTGSGRFRRIEVSIEPPAGTKLRVYHRRGYRDIDSGQQIEAAVRAALSFGYADNPMQVGLSAPRSSDRSDDARAVPLDITLPLDKLTLLPTDTATSNGKVTVFIGVRDGEGHFSPIERIGHSISVPTAALEQTPDATYRLRHTIQIRPGHQSLAIAVRDDLSSQHSIVLGGIDA